jgi:hypothetical protein
MGEGHPPRAQRYTLLLPLRVLARRFVRKVTSTKRKAVLVEQTVTENISSSGCFFRLTGEPEIGSKIRMEIDIGSEKQQNRGRALCRGKVVRVEPREGGKVGVACTIDHYRMQNSSPPAQHHAG